MARHRYDLTDAEWKIIEPLLPQKSRGVERVDDRRVAERYLLAHAIRLAVGRKYRSAMGPAHNLLQPLRTLAEGRHLGPAIERDLRGL